MPHETYRTQLNELREDVLLMATLVTKQLENGLDALCERGATAIIHDLIETEDRTEEAVEDVIRNVFWVALSLRDLERVGDYAVNIAARAPYLAENDDQPITN